MRGRRHASVPERMFFASEPSSSESQSEDDDVAWERTLCVALLAFAAALLVSAVALVIVSRGLPTGQHVQAHYKHLLHAPAGGAPARHLKRRQLSASGGTRYFGGQPRLQGAFPGAAAAAVEAVDAFRARDDDAQASAYMASGSNGDTKDQYRCDAVFYKFCTRPHREFFFSPAANACVPVGSNPAVQLCNRGANRYASLEDCSFDCVRTPRPSSRCFRTDLFTTCSSDDIVNGSSTWFFDGSGCHVWNFPSGQCPSFDADLFTSLAQCRTRCLPPEGMKTKSVVTEPVDRAVPANSYTCRVPRPSVCTGRQLRFPVFFRRAVGPEYRSECLSAGLVADTDHRCLTGRNKFRTQRDCENACAGSLEGNRPAALALLE